MCVMNNNQPLITVVSYVYSYLEKRKISFKIKLNLVLVGMLPAKNSNTVYDFIFTSVLRR